MRIVFQGPQPSVRIVATRQTVVRGIPVDVTRKIADRLLEQTCWVKAAKVEPANTQNKES
jgi:hypothetical protein